MKTILLAAVLLVGSNVAPSLRACIEENEQQLDKRFGEPVKTVPVASLPREQVMRVYTSGGYTITAFLVKGAGDGRNHYYCEWEKFEKGQKKIDDADARLLLRRGFGQRTLHSMPAVNGNQVWYVYNRDAVAFLTPARSQMIFSSKSYYEDFWRPSLHKKPGTKTLGRIGI